MTSPMSPLLVAIDAAITADSAIQLLGCSFFLGKAPAWDVLPRIVADELTEQNNNRLGRRGAIPAATLHIWAADHMAVANLYNELHRLLHLTPLSVVGHTVDRQDLNLLQVINDPSGYSHGIAEYRARTKVADEETSP